MDTFIWRTPWGTNVFHSDTAPADGVGAVGDFCINSSPATGKAMFWACIATASAPITWVPVSGIFPPNTLGSPGLAVFVAKAHLKHGDFSAAGLTKSVDAFSLPAHAKVVGAGAKITEIFAGTTTLTLKVGDAGDDDRYLAAYDGMVAVADTNIANAAAAGLFASYSDAAYAVKVLATATVANLDQLTTGEVDIWVAYVILP
jgi:hypothetical protein